MIVALFLMFLKGEIRKEHVFGFFTDSLFIGSPDQLGKKKRILVNMMYRQCIKDWRNDMTRLLVLVGKALTLLIRAHMLLCFGFVTKTVLMTCLCFIR